MCPRHFGERSRSCRFPPLIHTVRGQEAERQLRDRTPKCFAHLTLDLFEVPFDRRDIITLYNYRMRD